jgi:tetratricopeptide (TPR) repeat protein
MCLERINTPEMMKQLLFLLTAILVFAAGCGPSQKEYDQAIAKTDSLEKKIEQLQGQVAELQNTPHERLARARRLKESGNTEKAEKEFRQLVERYPDSDEAQVAEEAVAAIEKAREEKRRAAERRERLKYRVLDEQQTVSIESMELKIHSVRSRNKWIHDRYGSRWRYAEASRGNNFLRVNTTVSAESKDPDLPPIFVYRLSNGKLRLVDMMRYEFYRWSDYGNYLGNNHDFDNDFEYSSSVMFTAAVQVSENTLESYPVFVLVGKENCFYRTPDEYETPDIKYAEGSCTSRQTLSVEQAQSQYALIEIFNEDAMST